MGFDLLGTIDEDILSTLLVNGSPLAGYLPHYVYAFLERFTKVFTDDTFSVFLPNVRGDILYHVDTSRINDLFKQLFKIWCVSTTNKIILLKHVTYTFISYIYFR